MSKLTEEIKRLSKKVDSIDQRVEKIEENQLEGGWEISGSPIIASLSFEIPKSTPPPAPPETKFKVGDKFIPHKPENENGHLLWTTEMDWYSGKTLTVANVNSAGDLLTVEGHYWYFNPLWCTKVEEPRFKKGDWVRSLVTGLVGQVESSYMFKDKLGYYHTTIDGMRIMSFEDDLEPYFPREGEYFCIMSANAGKGLYILGREQVTPTMDILYIICTYSISGNCLRVVNDMVSRDRININEIRPLTSEEKKLLDSKLAEKGLRFDGKNIVKDNTPKVGDFCIFWDDKQQEKLLCGILCEFSVGFGFPFATNEGFRYKNCVKFESEEQFRKIKEGKQ